MFIIYYAIACFAFETGISIRVIVFPISITVKLNVERNFFY